MIISAQNVYVSDHFPFYVDDDKYLLADNVRIRYGPSPKDDILCTLPIGTRIKIEERTDRTYLYNNISFPWYKVSFVNMDKGYPIQAEGYVSGAFIAWKHYLSKKDKLLFLFGMSEYYPNEKKLKCQMRVSQYNKQLDRLDFFSTGTGPSCYFNLTIKDNESIGIDYITHIIQTNCFYETCASQMNSVTLFLGSNKRLYYLNSFHNEDNRYFTFKDKKIQLYHGEWVADDPNDEMNEEIHLEEELLQEYFWNGQALQKLY